MKKKSKHYRFAGEPKGPLTAAFEIDGKNFVTDRATLELLHQKCEHGSPRVAEWIFAVNMATGRIKREPLRNAD